VSAPRRGRERCCPSAHGGYSFRPVTLGPQLPFPPQFMPVGFPAGKPTMPAKVIPSSAGQILRKNRNLSAGRRLFGCLILMLVVAVPAIGQSSAKAASRRAAAENLTLQLSAIHSQYIAAGPGQRAGVLSQLQAVAAVRQHVLSALMESDPRSGIADSYSQ